MQKKIKLNLNLTLYIKIHSTWIIDLNKKISKLQEENRGKNLHVLGLGKEFFDMTTKVQSIRDKNW